MQQEQIFEEVTNKLNECIRSKVMELLKEYSNDEESDEACFSAVCYTLVSLVIGMFTAEGYNGYVMARDIISKLEKQTAEEKEEEKDENRSNGAIGSVSIE